MRQQILSKKTMLLCVILLLPTIGLIAVLAFYRQSPSMSNPDAVTPPATKIKTPVGQIKKTYEGQSVKVADSFSIRIPNGWIASIADTGTFQGLMFSRPEMLSTLVYDATKPAVIDRNGFPVPNRLTEHSFILTPAPGQEFEASQHREISSQTFAFDDGTVGTSYYVIKHADESQQYGGLLRDEEWQGRTYVYEKNGKRVEAHLALYPSSDFNTEFFDSVVRSITIE